jgi:hypothetical protein
VRQIAWSALVLIASLEPCWGGVGLRLHGNGIHWRDPQISLKISRTVHLAGSDLGVDARDTAAGVHATVVDAIQHWVKASEGTVKIAVELTDDQQVSPGQNLVTFTDPAPFDNGTCNKDVMVACALLNFNPGSGELLSASIAFNPYKRHSAIGMAGTNDIGLVMLHEVGHVLGLDHTPLTDAVMSAAAEMETVGIKGSHYAPRRLASDDTLTLRSLYGDTSALGRLQGRILQLGQTVPNAHVMAMTQDGLPVYSAQTDQMGQYMLWLPAGSYHLLAEPQDGPTLVAGPVFPTVFWTASGGHALERDVIDLGEAETKVGVDFAVGDGLTLNLPHIGLRANGRYVGYPRTVVARGRNYDLGMGRTPPGTPGQVRVVASKIEIDGDPVMPASGPGFVFQRIKVPADTPLGAYTVQFHTDSMGAVAAGAVRVAPNPQIVSAGPAEGEPGEPFIAGQQIVLTGTDLAAGEAQGERWSDGAPLPTQLEGTVVLVGEVYAQLVSVHPERIVLVVPTLPGAENAPIRVMTGVGVESNALEVKLTVQ